MTLDAFQEDYSSIHLSRADSFLFRPVVVGFPNYDWATFAIITIAYGPSD